MNSIVYPESEIIWQAIQSAQNILLHCHPGPDEDSIGGALATYNLLKNQGKSATVIQGDSPLPVGFQFLPGADEIVNKNFTEINLSQYDLFISQDASSLSMITKLGDVIFRPRIKVVVIDHHTTNTNYGDINLVDRQAPAVCEVLYNLFSSWPVIITPDIAVCLYVGLYGDTGGFKYPSTTPKTLKIASHLAEINHNFPQAIFNIENHNDQQKLYFMGLALNSIQTFYNNQVAIISVPNNRLRDLSITPQHTDKSGLANYLISVPDWQVGITLIETQPDIVNVSFRTRDSNKYDLSILAKSIGGGGHRSASGATLKMPLAQALELVLVKIEETFPNFN